MEVVNATRLARELDALVVAQDREWVAARVKYRTALVQKQLADAATRHPLAGSYPKTLAPTTPIDPADVRWLRAPGTGRPRRPGGFFSAVQRTIFVRSDQVVPALIAHEMTHAYASDAWNETQLLLSIWGLESEATDIDEGVTSELAGVVLYAQAAQQKRPGVRVAAPDGYAGYGPATRSQGAKFVQVIDGGLGTPGKATVAGYFDGRISVTIDTRAPKSSRMIVNGGAHPVSAVIV